MNNAVARAKAKIVQTYFPEFSGDLDGIQISIIRPNLWQRIIHVFRFQSSRFAKFELIANSTDLRYQRLIEYTDYILIRFKLESAMRLDTPKSDSLNEFSTLRFRHDSLKKTKHVLSY